MFNNKVWQKTSRIQSLDPGGQHKQHAVIFGLILRIFAGAWECQPFGKCKLSICIP